MPTIKKRIIITGLGLCAGFAAWPFVELMLASQGSFPSYLVFNILFGAVFGILLGAFAGSAEGLITWDLKRILNGVLTGAVVGLGGGIIGFLIGQAALFISGSLFIGFKSFNYIGLPIARAVGWAFMGVFIGMTEGIRARSFRKITVGLLGGLIGGIIGGLTIEYLKVLFPALVIARLAGLLLFGALIGFFYSIIEKRLSQGVIKLLTGKNKGKEFFINQHKLTIGSSGKNDISLPDYEMFEKHARIVVKHDDVIISKAVPNATVLVNDKPVDNYILKYEDVIKTGTAKFFYKHG